MRKQYMDFVPVKSAKQPANQQNSSTIDETAHRAVRISSTSVRSVGRISGRSAGNKANNSVSGGHNAGSRAGGNVGVARAQDQVKLGVIEDLSPKTEMRQEVASSPACSKAAERNLKAVKAQKIGSKSAGKPVEKPVEKSIQVIDDKYKTPKTPFINQDKVVKRPLSKNVYRKKVEALKEDAKAPVAIIHKPEKDSKVSLIVTIILTIILGAAAGTVAFLLLPK